MDGDSGPAIGVETRADYPLTERYLAPGDTVILFTDGVTEAVAEDGSLFGVERLTELLGGIGEPCKADDVARHITDALAGGTTRFRVTDDLTLLVVTFAPGAVTVSRTASGTLWRMETAISAAGVRQSRDWLHAILAARTVAAARLHDAELIAEELLTNVVKAARSVPAASQLWLECELTPREIVMTVRDDGPAFDPLVRAGPDLDADIADRQVGGLGIHLVRELAASCRYEHASGFNLLEVRLPRA
jgi:sigma-B regulation protein RsbU (phosphoserine phosphatase)